MVEDLLYKLREALTLPNVAIVVLVAALLYRDQLKLLFHGGLASFARRTPAVDGELADVVASAHRVTTWAIAQNKPELLAAASELYSQIQKALPTPVTKPSQ